MATEKTLNTRIKLRHDTYDAWHLANPTLLKGEIAIVELPSNPTNTDHGVIPPATLIKVGPGAFNSLPFLSATAADVHAWAKKSIVSYDGTNNKIVFSNGATDTNPISFDFDVVTPSELNTILANYYTKSDADTAITNAINALEVTDITGFGAGKTLASLTETNGKIAATFQDISITKSQISDFKEDDYATKAQGQAADAATTKLAGITTATVKEYVDGAIQGVVGGEVKYAEEAGKVSNKLTITLGSGDTVFDGSEAQSINIDNALGALRDDIGQNELAAIGERIGQAESQIGDVSGEVDVLKNSKLDASEFNTFKTNNTKAIGDAEKAAKDYADGLITNANLDQYTTEQEVKDIVDGVITGAVDGDTITGLANLVEYLNTHGAEAKEMGAAIDVLEGKVETIEGKPAYDITSKQVSDWDGEVGAKALAGTKTTTAEVKTQIEAYGYATTGYADQAEADAKSYADGILEDYTKEQANINNNFGDFIRNINDQETVSKANSAVQPGDLGTMAKETATNYVKKSEATGYDDILTKTSAATLYQPVGNYQPAGNYKTTQTAVSETGAADKTLKISQNANGEITATPVDIAIKASQVSGLANIATTGSTDDLVQGALTLIFDCGNATI